MKKLLIAVAISDEYKRVVRLLKNKSTVKISGFEVVSGNLGDTPVEVVMSSMGMVASKKAAIEIINGEKHNGVLILGYCGGLSHGIKVGDIVIPNKIIESAASFEMDARLIAGLGKELIGLGLNYKSVPLLTQKCIIETSTERLRLFKTTKAEAVDMETSEIIKIAKEKNIKAFALKVCIDDLENDLPPLQAYFETTSVLSSKEVGALVNKSVDKKSFSKNFKKGGDVFSKMVPLVATLVDNYWEQNP